MESPELFVKFRDPALLVIVENFIALIQKDVESFEAIEGFCFL
jgi:hypothetical protein